MSERLSPGERAPAFELPDTEGGAHALEADPAPATVVYWTCNHCPYALAWHERLLDVARDYADRGVRFLGINSNDAERYPADSFEAMQARAAEQGFNFPYLWDEDQSAAAAYGPSRTPEVFLFDAGRRLVYHGAIDDSRDETAVTRHYLRDALDAVLEGREPAVAETPPVGCSVKWKEPA